MAESRTTKWLAKRIEHRYIFRRYPLRLWRSVAVVASIVVALLWCASAGPLGHTRVLSPGHVSAAHAMWNNDCARCHAGGTSQRVSDSACLQCHDGDGAIHHPSQNSFISADRKHAARCADCHIEHRGRTVLAAVADRQCVACHRNITSAIRDGFPRDIEPRVTAFTIADHPELGRGMEPRGKPLLLTTLKFNHQRHLNRAGIQQDCTVCHSAANPDFRSHSEALKLPPWCDPGDRPSNWTDDSPRRYFRQITYQRDCIGCHRLDLLDDRDLSGLVVAPHVSLAELRDLREKLAQPPDQQRLVQFIAQLSPDDRSSLLTRTETKTNPFTRKTVTSTVTKSQEQWVEDSLKKIHDSLPDKTSNEDKFVLQISAQCMKCHELTNTRNHSDAPAPEASRQPTSTDATTAPTGSTPGASTQPVDLATVPTNLPSYPRRWYANSIFDHDAHRNMKCLECHKLSSSDATRPPGSDIVFLPTIEICARCHVPKDHSILHVAADFAPAGCVTCHVFHDRNRETVHQGALTIEQLLRPSGHVSPRTPSQSPPAPSQPTSQPVAATEQHP